MSTQFLTSVGRLVQGSPGKGFTKDTAGNPLVYKSGAHKGEPRTDYSFKVAFPKDDPKTQEFIKTIQQEASNSWPGTHITALSTKITDGDSTQVDKKGVPTCDRLGYKGNWIVKFSGSYAPNCYSAGGASILPPEEIKTGFYIRVYGSVGTNNSKQSPGVFVNHSYVELVAFGDEINSAPAASSIFAAPAGPLPSGAQSTPVTPATTAPIPPAPAAPAVQVEIQAADGNWYTKEQCLGFGWTQEQIDACPTRNI